MLRNEVYIKLGKIQETKKKICAKMAKSAIQNAQICKGAPQNFSWSWSCCPITCNTTWLIQQYSACKSCQTIIFTQLHYKSHCLNLSMFELVWNVGERSAFDWWNTNFWPQYNKTHLVKIKWSIWRTEYLADSSWFLGHEILCEWKNKFN